MYDQYKPEGLFVGYTVEDEHGLDGEVPRASSIGRWHDNSKVGHDEADQRTANAQVLREVETEERQVVVQEVAHPDANGEKQVERQVLDPPQREHALPNAAQCHLHLIIYREVLQQQMEQNQDCHTTDGCDEPSRQRKAIQDSVERSTGLLKECAKDAHLNQKNQPGIEHHNQRINSALCHHRTKCLAERHPIVMLQNGASREFSDTRNQQTGSIRDEYSMYAGSTSCTDLFI